MWSQENVCSVELHHWSCNLEGEIWQQTVG